MENIINELNEIYTSQAPITFNSEVWDKFGLLIKKCKDNGYQFKRLWFDREEFERFKEKGADEITQHMDALCNSIDWYRENMLNDKLYSESPEYKKFMQYYLDDQERERDFLFADLVGQTKFLLTDNKTIQYSRCINEIYDFKIRYYIGR